MQEKTKNFIKQNWFKIIIAIAILIVAISVAYFFVGNSFKTAISDNGLVNQQLCADQSSKTFKILRDTTTPSTYDITSEESYTNHYNQKLNKCFMLVIVPSAGGQASEVLYDSDSIKQIAWKSYESNLMLATVCDLNGKYISNCTSDVFDNFVKTYMEN